MAKNIFYYTIITIQRKAHICLLSYKIYYLLHLSELGPYYVHTCVHDIRFDFRRVYFARVQ